MSNKDNPKKVKKANQYLSAIMILIFSPIILITITIILLFILGLLPFATIGFLIYKWFEFRNIKHLRKMKLEYKLKSLFQL